MISPIVVAKVYLNQKELKNACHFFNSNTSLVNLFLGNWLVSPKSYPMRIECDSDLDRITDKMILHSLGPKEVAEAYGLLPLENAMAKKYSTLPKVECSLEVNRELHNFVYGQRGEEENPFVIVANIEPDSTICLGEKIYFSNAALDCLKPNVDKQKTTYTIRR